MRPDRLNQVLESAVCILIVGVFVTFGLLAAELLAWAR